MFKILLGMLIIISSVVYTGDLAELKNINSLFVDETKNIVKKCVLATDNYQPYFNVNLLSKNVDKYIEDNYSKFQKLEYNIEFLNNDLPDEVKISIFFKINLLTKFQKSVSYRVTTNGRFVNE